MIFVSIRIIPWIIQSASWLNVCWWIVCQAYSNIQ